MGKNTRKPSGPGVTVVVRQGTEKSPPRREAKVESILSAQFSVIWEDGTQGFVFFYEDWKEVYDDK
jgi:hypothetical protein